MGSGDHNYNDSNNDHGDDDPRDGIVDHSALVRSSIWTMMMMMMKVMMMWVVMI